MPIQWGQFQQEPSEQWYDRRAKMHFDAQRSRLRQYNSLANSETYMEYLKDFIIDGPSPARYNIHGEGYRHHFIPKFVLYPFSANDKPPYVGRVSLKGASAEKVPLEEAAMCRGLYDVVLDDGSISDIFECFLAQIERKSSSPYKKLRRGLIDHTCDGWDRLLIARLMALQVVRTPKHRHRVRRMLEDMLALEGKLRDGLPPSGEVSGKESGIRLPETDIGNKQNITQYSFIVEVMWEIERNIFSYDWEIIDLTSSRLCIGDNGIFYGDGNAFANYGYYAMPIAPHRLWGASVTDNNMDAFHISKFVPYLICDSAHQEIYCHPRDIRFWESKIREYKQFREHQLGLVLP